jgi:hypothetical protein
MNRKVAWVILFIPLFLQLGCGKIPEDTVGNADSLNSDRAYVDTDWGFQVFIPDNTTWGYSSQTSYQARASNGLPLVQVTILRIPYEGSTYRPVMTLEPRVLPRNATLESYAASLEEEYKGRIMGYQPEEKRVFKVSGRDAMEWTFRSVFIRSIGDRYVSTIVVDEQKVYVLLGTGQFSSFPLEEYRSIAASMIFP